MKRKKKALFEKLKRKFEMNIGIYYTRPLKDKMVYKARNGIEIKIKGYGGFSPHFPCVVLSHYYFYIQCFGQSLCKEMLDRSNTVS